MNYHPSNGQIENFQLARLIKVSETTNILLVRILQETELNNKFNRKILQTLRLIALEDAPPRLTEIQISFSKGTSMPTPGPVTLTAVGQQVTATVLGFDQFGQPFNGVLPPFTLSSDDTSGAIVTFDPTTGLTTAVADGVANITASLTTAEGVALTDTEAVTVAISPPPPQTLTTIKVAF